MMGLVVMLFFVSVGFSGLIRAYALHAGLLDIPNHRSSHTVPTPRGGGIGFILVFLSMVAYHYVTDSITGGEALAFLGAGFGVAGVGYCDDHFNISATRRLVWHFLMAALALYGLGGMPSIDLLGWQWAGSSLWLNGIGIVYLVWFLNLYNFMDGINGLATMEAVVIGVGGILLYYALGYDNAAKLPLIWTVAVAGFLPWNFPTARLFMGDVGSGFLGFTIGLFSIQAGKVDPALFWCWLILSGAFIVDATVTLITRWLSGYKLYEAHRTHAYQQAVIRWNSHVVVTLAFLGVNLVWLMPIAYLVSQGYCSGLIGLIVAYSPLVGLVLWFRRGV